ENIELNKRKANVPISPNYGIIMIDPFPNFEDNTEEKKEAPTIFIWGILKKIINAVRRQAMVKEADIVRGFSTKDSVRGMVFPVIWKEGFKERFKYPLASGGLGGFSGLFDKKLREHDYLLGRENCKVFLWKYFSVKEANKAKYDIFKDWTDKMSNRFAVIHSGDTYLPIIPNVLFRNSRTDEKEEYKSNPFNPKNYFNYRQNKHSIRPQLPKKNILAYRKIMAKRLRRMTWSLIKAYLFSKRKSTKKKRSSSFGFRYSLLFRLGQGLIWVFLIVFSPLILLLLLLSPLLIYLLSFFVSEKVILKKILSEFEEMELLRKEDK
ncbi:MAG: hypothetical protein AAF960_27155, partial [Bacteroidota bacterium]